MTPACLWCGADFQPYTDRMGRPKGVCSRRCRDAINRAAWRLGRAILKERHLKDGIPLREAIGGREG